jgi:hypothetical protein
MYKAYFTKRLLEALNLANEATDAKERSTHLLASCYYCELLGLERVPRLGSNSVATDEQRI